MTIVCIRRDEVHPALSYQSPGGLFHARPEIPGETRSSHLQVHSARQPPAQRLSMLQQRHVSLRVRYDRTDATAYERSQQGLDVDEDVIGQLQKNMTVHVRQCQDLILGQQPDDSLVQPNLSPGEHRQVEPGSRQLVIQLLNRLAHMIRARTCFESPELVRRRHYQTDAVVNESSAKRQRLSGRCRPVVDTWQTMAVHIHELAWRGYQWSPREILF